jgi:hypothetical protein
MGQNNEKKNLRVRKMVTWTHLEIMEYIERLIDQTDGDGTVGHSPARSPHRILTWYSWCFSSVTNYTRI